MKNKRFYTFLMLALTAVILIISTVPQNTATVVAAAPPQQTNLLTNGGFEDFGGGQVAVGWTSWFRNTEKQSDCSVAYWVQPGWGGATDFKNSGTYSQFLGNSWDTWMGGVYQTVSVTPGSTYRFSFKAYGYAGAGGGEASDNGVNLQVRAAVDLTGGSNWGGATAGNVGSPHQVWQDFSVEFTATGDKVTVFTVADTAVSGVNQCRAQLNTYYDDASLVEVGPPPTATSAPLPTSPPQPAATNTPVPPTATATSEVPPTSTAVPTAEPTAIPEGGSVCLNAFADTNGNGVHDAGEGYMAGVTFEVANTERIVGNGVSAGTDTPVCFDGLEAGDYQASQILPSRLEATTASQAMVNVTAGNIVGVEFGSKIRSDEAAATAVPDDGETEAPTDGEDDGSSTPIAAYVGLAAIGLVILALIGLVIKTLKK